MTSFRTISIPAGTAAQPGVVPENISGRFYATVTCSAQFFVRPDNEVPVEQNQGRHFGSKNGKEWGKLTFYNYTASAITITYYSGQDQYIPDPAVIATINNVNVTVSSTNKPTYTKGTTGTVGGGGTAFSGVDGTNARKSFSVFNEEAAGSGNVIQVRGANGTKGHLVDPRTSYLVESGGAVTLIGSGFAFSVMEVFYLP